MARSQNKLVFKPRTCHLRFSRRQKISRARHGQVRDVFCPGRKTSKRLFLKSVGLFRCVNRLRKAKRSDPPRSDRNRYNSTSSYVEADSEVSRNALGKSLGSLSEVSTRETNICPTLAEEGWQLWVFVPPSVILLVNQARGEHVSLGRSREEGDK